MYQTMYMLHSQVCIKINSSRVLSVYSKYTNTFSF